LGFKFSILLQKSKEGRKIVRKKERMDGLHGH
jgi:hypothetical protein